MASKTFRVGAIGYGGAFNMGKLHLETIRKSGAEFVPTAVCDADAARVKVAATDFPGIQTYTDVDEMLAKAKLDLVIIITPHNTHAELAVKCLDAGAAVVVEKPMAITTAEIDAMLAAARKSGKMLSTFHNRRWDGDYLALKKIVADGWVGKLVRVDAFMGWHGPQGKWWRSVKQISGGSIYDWGAHFTDWILGLVEGPVKDVVGFQHKNPAWSQYDNEDHSEAHIRFESGTLVTLTISNLTSIGRPRWTINGEAGGIVSTDNGFTVKSLHKGKLFESSFANEKGDWEAYYRNVADHLLTGAPLAVTAESAARVIAVLDSANLSAAKGGAPVTPKYR
jgi:scyllo-inositol 2-dehydrogenase (NADP+)